jgi:ADP-ribose pyrophosphatase
MGSRGRAQCLIVRDGKILVVVHSHDGVENFCLPGGGIEEGETPIEAAARELLEECNLVGTNLKLISEVTHDNHQNYTFSADIGSQESSLGVDPEVTGPPVLVGVEWRALNTLSERDRAYMWAAGLFSYDEFAKELDSWGDDVSYPRKRGDN